MLVLVMTYYTWAKNTVGASRHLDSRVEVQREFGTHHVTIILRRRLLFSPFCIPAL